MEDYVQRINNFIQRARKTLLIIIGVIFMMIYIRGCINQMAYYKEDIEHLQVRILCARCLWFSNLRLVVVS